MTEDEFLIGELAQKTNVSVRTIRYYINQGLLPAPDSRGRYTVYDNDYVERILLIKRLKDAFLPIKEIRVMLETQTRAEIEEFLRMFKMQRAQKNDALSYINNLLGHSISEPSQSTIRSKPMLKESGIPPQPALQFPQQRESSWKRIVLAPGVELHIEQHQAARYDKLIQALLADYQVRFSTTGKQES
ncbi:MAG: hypothetical protein BGO78_06330 [Chloroflexi bacterium 44-23]|nr:MAG: hypothetical protein BGO78_06330 [Chloroflexi bacterium 44-23]